MSDPNGLLYMQNRYYNPYLCRFINADPSGFSGGLNWYAYANGNPVSYLDPFGLGAAGEGSLSSWLDNNTYDFSPAGQFMSAYQQTQSQMQQFQSFQPDSPNGGGLSSFLNGTPFLGGAKMTAEQVFTGHDLITGESVDGLSWLSVAAIGASLIPLPLEAGAEEVAAEGRGLIGLVRPGGTIDSSLGSAYSSISSSDQFARALARYNGFAKTFGLSESAGVDEIQTALANNTTFARTSNLKAGLFPTEGGYYLQGNPLGLYGARAGSHELVHLGAALNGQGDSLLHEIGVQWATTPEILVGGGALIGGATVGGYYWATHR